MTAETPKLVIGPTAVRSTIYQPHTISSAGLNANGELEIVRRFPSNSQYLCSPPRPVPDRIIKEIYRVVDGKIELAETVVGKHILAKQIAERIEFEPLE